MAREGRARGCRVPGTLLLLLAYLSYLALGTGVFWVLESPAAQDSSARFQHDKWALLQNFTCLDGPALDSLIRVRGVRRDGSGERGLHWQRERRRVRLGTGKRCAHLPKRGGGHDWAARFRAEEGLPRAGLERKGKGPTAARGVRGAAPGLTRPVRRAAWRAQPDLGMRTRGGALARLRSGQGRPGTARRGVGVGSWAKDERAPSTEMLGANLRIEGEDGRGRWVASRSSRTASAAVGFWG